MNQRAFSGYFLVLSAFGLAMAEPAKVDGLYQATAYAQKGVTASGQLAHPHVVAADPDILPIGSRVKIRHAGPYSGEYVVADTGAKIQGRRLDIYLPSASACKRFGTKIVTVKVVQLGDGTHQSAKEADRAVKQDVRKDVVNNVVGNAATAADVESKSAVNNSARSTNVQPKPKADKPDHP